MYNGTQQANNGTDSMKIKQISFSSIPRDAVGVVIKGVQLGESCDDDAWIDLATTIMKNGKACSRDTKSSDLWTNAFLTSTPADERDDLVLYADPSKLDTQIVRQLGQVMPNLCVVIDWLVDGANEYYQTESFCEVPD